MDEDGKGQARQALRVALRAADPGAVAAAIAMGADVEEPCMLHKALMPHMEETEPTRPVAYAVERNMEPCLRALLAAGADPDACEEKRLSPPAFACWHGYAGCLAALLEAGADADGRIDMGITPLMAAAGTGHLECLRLLIKARADVEALMEGWSAAMLAVQSGHFECLRMLAAAGARLDQGPGRDGADSLLGYARLESRVDIAEWLEGVLDARGEARVIEAASNAPRAKEKAKAVKRI